MTPALDLLSILRRAGWFPNRRVDVQYTIPILQENGSEVHETALGFLREYASLTLKFPHARVAGVMDDVHIDPVLASLHVGPGWAEHYSERLGEPLCVVGEAYRGNMVMLVAPSGKTVLGRDELLLFAGESPIEAFTKIILDQVMPEIPELPEDEEEP
jgi:hypothetical protein